MQNDARNDPVRPRTSLDCGQTDAGKIAADQHTPGEVAVAHCPYIICLGQGTSWNLEWTLPRSAKRRDEMREHEVLCARALCHGTEVGCRALPIIGMREESA